MDDLTLEQVYRVCLIPSSAETLLALHKWLAGGGEYLSIVR